VYDSVGQEVARLIHRELSPGNYKIQWDATNFASGIYYYKIEAGENIKSRKLTLLK